jgi:hypothetical protein
MTLGSSATGAFFVFFFASTSLMGLEFGNFLFHKVSFEKDYPQFIPNSLFYALIV